MNELTGSRICGGNTAYSRKESDFYPTPPDATNALLDFLNIQMGSHIWEPACGENHMVDVFKERTYDPTTNVAKARYTKTIRKNGIPYIKNWRQRNEKGNFS